MRTPFTPLALLLVSALLVACAERPIAGQDGPAVRPVADLETDMTAEMPDPSKLETATLGAGCFWCVEAVLEQYDGIYDVRSGYMGGDVAKPTYEQVCTGTTGHAEVVQLRFDPEVISFDQVLQIFWKLHDPTTLNRQGADVGTQYRSAIFVHSDEQRKAAEASLEALDASGTHDDPVVTQIADAATFYEAEKYHQDYYRQNKNQGYCRMVIAPKLDKLGLEK